jgi:hypothetical protein
VSNFTILSLLFGLSILLRYVIDRHKGDANASMHVFGFRIGLQKTPPTWVYFACWLTGVAIVKFVLRHGQL